MQFTQEELRNILALINIAPIKGGEAFTVANLQVKIQQMIENNTVVEKPVEKKEE